MYKSIKRYLTWATFDEAMGDKPLPKYKVFFRKVLP